MQKNEVKMELKCMPFRKIIDAESTFLAVSSCFEERSDSETVCGHKRIKSLTD